jgi:hypothetical protein
MAFGCLTTAGTSSQANEVTIIEGCRPNAEGDCHYHLAGDRGCFWGEDCFYCQLVGWELQFDQASCLRDLALS